MRRLCVLLVSFALLKESAWAQLDDYVVYRLAEPDTLFLAFGDRPCAALHYALPDSIAPGRWIDLAAPLLVVAQVGRLAEHPRRPVGRQASDVAKSTEAYESGDFERAVDRARSLVMQDPSNPFYIDAYARALFRISARGPLARDVYMGLVGLLDEQAPFRDSVIPIDVHFAEAYSKLGALHLDAQQYDSAAFELTRAVIAGFHNTSDAMRQFTDLQLSYLTEAYAELGLPDVARWFGGAALRWNPANQYVLPYLRRLGPQKERIVECTFAEESGAGEGVYTLVSQQTGDSARLGCLAPPADMDGTIGPCLRIGEVFVGVGEEEVRASIGSPTQSVTTEGGGQAYMYLIFHDHATNDGAYYVIEYEEQDDERIVGSVQLTGQPPPIPISFSCFKLGSTEESVIRQIGYPTVVDTVMVDHVDAPIEFWRYDPYPITIEILNGVVYSIKVWRSDDLPRVRRRPSLFYRR